jgi:NhaP-type Na+/H+ and K+/H+ antiporter
VFWGAAVVVLLSAVSSALINELHSGWIWSGAAIVIVLVSALVAGWVAKTPSAAVEHNAGSPKRVQDISDAKVAGDIDQQLKTAKARGVRSPATHRQQVRKVDVSGSIRQSQEDI